MNVFYYRNTRHVTLLFLSQYFLYIIFTTYCDYIYLFSFRLSLQNILLSNFIGSLLLDYSKVYIFSSITILHSHTPVNFQGILSNVLLCGSSPDIAELVSDIKRISWNKRNFIFHLCKIVISRN